MKTFGEILKEKRIAVGLSQRKLAKKLCVEPMTLNAWERGKTYPHLLTACDIADFFSCSLDELAGRANNGKTL